MIPRLIFVWFFSFGGTSYVVPIILYNVKKVSNSNMHIESKTQNTKRRMETKKIHYFIFELKNPRTLILWRRLFLWVMMAATLPIHVLVVFCVVAFIILSWNIWVIFGSWKSWGSAVFDSEHIKNDSQFAIPNRLIRYLTQLFVSAVQSYTPNLHHKFQKVAH